MVAIQEKHSVKFRFEHQFFPQFSISVCAVKSEASVEILKAGYKRKNLIKSRKI